MIKIYETPYGKVELPLDTKNVIVRLSGGFDSAVMLSLLAMNAVPGTVFHPITTVKGRVANSPFLDRVDVSPIAKKVAKHIQEKYSDRNITILEPVVAISFNWHETRSYVETQNYLIQTAAERVGEGDPNFKYTTIEYNGVTKNPPIQIAPDDFHSGREEHRDRRITANDSDTSSSPDSVTVLRIHNPKHLKVEPFANADKRVTMWLADHIGELDTLLKISRSCEGNRETTDNWTKECVTHCWWCYERYWALENFKGPNE